MPRVIRCSAAVLLLSVVLVAGERAAQAQVAGVYYAPAVPVTTYYAPAVPVAAYYAPAYNAYYGPAVVAAPAVTRVRVRRPWLAPRTTVVRQRTVPVATPVVVAPYWP